MVALSFGLQNGSNVSPLTGLVLRLRFYLVSKNGTNYAQGQDVFL